MSVGDKARGVLGDAFAQRLGGEQPGKMQAAAGAAVAGGITSVVVFRLLRQQGED
jgi:hypothetical protein